MKPVPSKLYRIQSVISENSLSQSIIATRLDNGERCFLKCPSDSPDMSDDNRRSILSQSFENQKRLRSGFILRAEKLTKDNSILFVEYPYLAPPIWQAFTPGIFQKYFPTSLHRMALIIDYLHLYRLVHCDIKPDSFLVSTRNGKISMKLVDLDFLTLMNTKPEARIIGTPEFIAPEILTNNSIVIQSDNYSFGILLKNVLAQNRTLKSTTAEYGQSLNNLEKLIEALTVEDYGLRPRSVINALHDNALLDDEEYGNIQRTLLAAKLLTDWRADNVPSKNEDKCQRLLSPKNGIWGIPDEMIGDIQSLYKKGKLFAYNAISSIVRDADIKRYDEYWQLSISDCQAETIYHAIDKELGRFSVNFADITNLRKADINKHLGIASKYRDEENCHRAFIEYRRLLGVLDEDDHDNYGKITLNVLTALYKLARTLGRLKDCRDYLERVLEFEKIGSENYLSLLYELTRVLIYMGEYDQAEETIEEAVNEAESLENPHLFYSFSRQKAWILSAKGDSESADKIHNSNISRAKESNDIKEIGKIHIVRGVDRWRRGMHDIAEMDFIKGMKLLRSTGTQSDLISPLTNLSMLYIEVSKFEKAVKYALEAIKSLDIIKDRPNLSNMYLNLVLGLISLGDYKKAEYELQKSLSVNNYSSSISCFASYNYQRASLEKVRSNFLVAKDYLNLAGEMYTSDIYNRNVGKVHQCNAEIALFGWDNTAFDSYSKLAKDIFNKAGDKSSFLEIEALECLYDVLYRGQSAQRLVEYYNRLLEVQSVYDASVCYFVLLARRGEPTASMENSASRVFKCSKTPLFRALLLMIEARREQSEKRSEGLIQLKEAYRILTDARMNFYACLVCNIIADIHSSHSSVKLASRFKAQALKLAESIGNQYLVDELEKEPDIDHIDTISSESMLRTFQGISSVLHERDNYDAALEKLIRYALEITGAERGVLLLKAGQSSELNIRAYVNCDDDSFGDIVDISRNIPHEVVDNPSTMIIDDATEDTRTKSYKSIIKHNIMSVICVPLKSKDRLFGALYLDHHTIPALFDKNDVSYITAIANFISVLLVTLKDHKQISSSKNQLSTDLVRYGASQPFITKSTNMESLLSNISVIAKSNADVMLYGESGTGKEILCQMIHDKSPRENSQLLKLNCAAIPDTMIEAELFGIGKNVATGVDRREGKFSAADGGTLFLDEIGDMPLDVQAKVLHVLESGEFFMVGSNRISYVDVRFIFATNKNLKALVKENKFRGDLLYRINKFDLEIPPLRERREDIPLLIEYYMDLFSRDKSTPPYIPDEVMNAMISYDWPGNVRELKNMIDRLCILFGGKTVNITDLSAEIQNNFKTKGQQGNLKEIIEKAEILNALIASNGNKSMAAMKLGMPYTTFCRKVKKYGLKPPYDKPQK